MIYMLCQPGRRCAAMTMPGVTGAAAIANPALAIILALLMLGCMHV
jgi:hypothetical protein